MRLFLRVADTTLPVFLVVYLGGAWLFWGDGATGHASEPGAELSALARWLCLGWLPSAMLSLGLLYGRASHGKLSALSTTARHGIACGFLATVPLWLAVTEWAVHRLHRGVVACDGALLCTAGGPAPVPELATQGKPSASVAATEATAEARTDTSRPHHRQSETSHTPPRAEALPDPRGGALPLRPKNSAAALGESEATPSPEPFAGFPAAPSADASGNRFPVTRTGLKVRDGARTEWWPTGGRRSEGRYVDGMREGPWREWCEDGTLALSATFKNGKPQGDLQRWHPDGQVALHRDELRTEDGRVLWIEEAFHTNGLRARRAQYQDGVLHGPSQGWNEEGALLEAGPYRAGQRHGSWIRYEASGAVASSQQWEHGSRVHSSADSASPQRLALP